MGSPVWPRRMPPAFAHTPISPPPATTVTSWPTQKIPRPDHAADAPQPSKTRDVPRCPKVRPSNSVAPAIGPLLCSKPEQTRIPRGSRPLLIHINASSAKPATVLSAQRGDSQRRRPSPNRIRTAPVLTASPPTPAHFPTHRRPPPQPSRGTPANPAKLVT